LPIDVIDGFFKQSHINNDTFDFYQALLKDLEASPGPSDYYLVKYKVFCLEIRRFGCASLYPDLNDSASIKITNM
jgi:hypothetical protein